MSDGGLRETLSKRGLKLRFRRVTRSHGRYIRPEVERDGVVVWRGLIWFRLEDAARDARRSLREVAHV